MTEKKESNVFYINHSGELLIWLMVILGVVVVTFFSNLSSDNKENKFDIFMPDVDGLIVGSPVRAMGIEVGHVIKIKPVKDEVYIRFMITDDSVKIPQGTVATVEFSGLAGSKSLELYLPDENTYIDSSVPIISASSPKRLHDAAGLLREMFNEIGSIIAVSSQFAQKLGKIDFPEAKGGVDDASEFIKYVDGVIDVQQHRVDDLGRKLENARKGRER